MFESRIAQIRGDFTSCFIRDENTQNIVLSVFERERAEAAALLTSDEITKAKHETPFNATEQDNPTASL